MSSRYVDSFGLQWNRFRRVQLDSYTGTTISADRLFSSSAWSPSALSGSLVLEAGSGAGRFTEVLLAAGARVVSFDLSTAVWANRANNQSRCALILQADIYRVPCREAAFDHVLCLGVLQHCPDPGAAFRSLVPFVKPGGDLVIDVYDADHKNGPDQKPGYIIRRVTSKLPPRILLTLVRLSASPLLRVKRAIKWLSRRMPYVGLLYAWIPVFDYRGTLPLTDRQVEQWAVLDTFDFLSPRYDQPQTLATVRSWFETSGLQVEFVRKGGNGIVGRGRRV